MTDRRYAATKELVESWNRSRTHGTGDAVGMYTDTSAGSLSSAETSCRTDLRLLLPPAPSDLLALWLERSGLTLMSCSRAPINSWLEVRMRPCVCVCVFQDCSVGHWLQCVFVNSGFLFTPKTDAVGPSFSKVCLSTKYQFGVYMLLHVFNPCSMWF